MPGPAVHFLEGPAEAGEAFGVVVRLEHQSDAAVRRSVTLLSGRGKILAGQPEVDHVLATQP